MVILVGASVLYYINYLNQIASGIDKVIPFANAGEPPENCFMDGKVELSKRTISIKETSTVKVNMLNPHFVPCIGEARINAPQFNSSPKEDVQTVKLTPEKQTGEVAWIIQPREMGEQELVVDVGHHSYTFGIYVTNVMGLSPLQAEVLSYLGFFLGPMLTLPWWYGQWQERKKKKEEQEQKEKEERDRNREQKQRTEKSKHKKK